MLNIGKFVLAAILVVPAVAKDSSGDILNKSLPEFSAWPGTEFETLCRVSNIVCGEEMADSKKFTKAGEPLFLTSTTVKGVLNAIVARYHGYKWTLSNGVVNLLPVNGYGLGSGGGLLSSVVMPAGPISEDLLEICRAAGNGCVTSAEEYLDANSEKPPGLYRPTLTITIADGETLGDVLNTLVLLQRKHLWRIKPLGRNGYQIDMVVWLGPDRTRLMGPKKYTVAETKVEKESVEAKVEKERAALDLLYKRKREIESAEMILEHAANKKRLAKAPKIMEECRAELEAFTKEPHALEDFERLAAKYKKKNPEAALFVRKVALAKLAPDEAERLALAVLAEADKTKSPGGLTFDAVERLWELEVEKRHYHTAMTMYSDAFKKYGCYIIDASCDRLVDEKVRYIAELWSAESKIKALFEGLSAAEAKGNIEEISGYFDSDSLAQWYVERFGNRRNREFLSAVIKVDRLRSGKVTLRERFTNAMGKREIGQLDCSVIKVADRWKISNVIPDDKFLNRSISEFYALPGTEFETLCRIAGLRCGEEIAVSAKQTVVKETLALTTTTVKEALNAIVVRYPEYRWTVSNGVVNLLPVGGAGMGVNGDALSAAVLPGNDGFASAGRGSAVIDSSVRQIRGDMTQICKYMGRECVAGGVRYVDFESSHIPDRSANANLVAVRSGERLGQVLNKVLLNQSQNMWRISPKDSKSYTIEAVVWPSRRIPKAMRVLALAERKARADKEAAEQRLKLEEEAILAETMKRNALAEKAMAEEQKIMNECRAEIESLRLKPHSVADFDQLAAKYQTKNRAAELYVRMEATYEVSAEEEVHRCRELLAEAGASKSLDPVLVLRLLDRIWTIEINIGNYFDALFEYREGMEKYGRSFLGDYCDDVMRDRKSGVKYVIASASAKFDRHEAASLAKGEIERMLWQLWAADREGDEKAIMSYFAQPPRVKTQKYQQNLQKLKNYSGQQIQENVVNVWSETSANISLRFHLIDSNVNAEQLDLGLEKTAGQWKIVFVW